MLIRFTVENFLSFKDEIEFSMVPGRARKHSDHIYVDERRQDLRLLKTGIVFGANASGKTNIMKALSFSQDFIVEGRKPDQDVAAHPFRLDLACESKPSRFTFEIKSGAKAYIYKFVADMKRVHCESLSELRSTSEKLLFTRNVSPNGRTQIQFGKIPRMSYHTVDDLNSAARLTRPNQLFLYESVDSNIAYFRDVYDWFKNQLVLIYPYTIPGAELGARFVNNEDGFQQKYRDLLQLYDLDIDDIELRKINIDIDQLFSEQDKLNISQYVSQLPDDPAASAIYYNPVLQLFVFVNRHNDYQVYQFVTVHNVEHEERTVNFELFMESDGTIRLFELTPALIRLLNSEEEIVFVVDELDRSLHAQMTRNILDIFLSNSVGKPSQMIATTHESSMLDLDLLRRDEIWFIEKDRYSASQVYSLEEFAPRYDMDVERGYLLGRFGAIPILPSYNLLEWSK